MDDGKTKWCTTDILIPHETVITLVFWHQQWLWVMPPSLSNIRWKWPTPVRNWSYCVTSISCDIWQMALQLRHSCLANSSASRPAQNHWQCWQLHNGLFGRRQSHGLSAVAELLVSSLPQKTFSAGGITVSGVSTHEWVCVSWKPRELQWRKFHLVLVTYVYCFQRFDD